MTIVIEGDGEAIRLPQHDRKIWRTPLRYQRRGGWYFLMPDGTSVGIQGTGFSEGMFVEIDVTEAP